jgi:hypothetical protein
VAALDAIPFSAAERADGEAELKTLVRARLSPVPTRAAEGASAGTANAASPASQADSSDPSVPVLIKTAADASGVRAGSHAEADALPATRPAPTRPLAVPAAARAASTGSEASGPATTTGTRNPQRASRRPPTAAHREHGWRWRVAAITAVVVVAVVGAGFVVAARRAAAGGAGGHPVHLDGLQMRQIGHKAYQSGDYELARRFFVRAALIDPDDRDAQEDLGCALLKLGRADSARSHFQLAHREQHPACK